MSWYDGSAGSKGSSYSLFYIKCLIRTKLTNCQTENPTCKVLGKEVTWKLMIVLYSRYKTVITTYRHRQAWQQSFLCVLGGGEWGFTISDWLTPPSNCTGVPSWKKSVTATGYSIAARKPRIAIRIFERVSAKMSFRKKIPEIWFE